MYIRYISGGRAPPHNDLDGPARADGRMDLSSYGR